MDTTQLVRDAAPIGYSSLARGHIYGGEKHPKAAPTSFSERVWVILPEGSSEHLYGPCRWLAGHGTAKPQPGAECVVGFDEQNQPAIVWWEGVQVEPTATGTAGGDLEGTYPNPTIKPEAVTEAKLTAAVVAKLNPSAWANPTGFNAKLEETTTIQVRTEQGAAVARLKGLTKTKEAIAAKGGLFTLPAGFRPSEARIVTGNDATSGAAQLWRVNATGVVESEFNMTTTHFFSFDGCTFNLT